MIIAISLVIGVAFGSRKLTSDMCFGMGFLAFIEMMTIDSMILG